MIEETVGSVARLVGGVVHGDESRPVTGVADFRSASPTHVGFLNDKNLVPAARDTVAAALIVAALVDTPAAQIVVANVMAAFARVAQHFHPEPFAERHEVHPSAVVAADAVLHEPVVIGPGSVVGPRAEIGAGTILQARVSIGEGCRLGERCKLHPGVVLYPGVIVGRRVILHAGCVLGSDGFGYAQDTDGSHVKFPQVGTVIVGDDVEIGANTTVDRAALGATKIGRGSKIDNLVHIAHNCELGEHVAVAGLSAFAGSTILGDRVMVAGHTVSAGHLRVAADVRIGGNTVLYRDIDAPGDYIGYPPQRKRRWFRTLRAIDELLELKADVTRLLEEREQRDRR